MPWGPPGKGGHGMIDRGVVLDQSGMECKYSVYIELLRKGEGVRYRITIA